MLTSDRAEAISDRRLAKKNLLSREERKKMKGTTSSHEHLVADMITRSSAIGERQ